MNELLALIQAGLTPEEAEGLRGIANLRAAGFTDQEIFGMGSPTVRSYATGAAPMRLGTGAAYLPTAADLAATTATYRLGRGQLAQGAQEFAHQRAVDEAALAARPFNTLQYLGYLARTGRRSPLLAAQVERLDPVRLSPSELDEYEQYVRDFLSYPQEEPGDIQRVRQARREHGDAAVAEAFKRFAEYDRRKAFEPLGFAGGGKVLVADEEIIGIGKRSGKPRFRLGEKGPEKLEITPFAEGGDVVVKPRRKFTPAAPRGLPSLREQLANKQRMMAQAARFGDWSAALRRANPAASATGPDGVVADNVRFVGQGTAGDLAGFYERQAARMQRKVQGVGDLEGRVAKYDERRAREQAARERAARERAALRDRQRRAGLTPTPAAGGTGTGGGGDAQSVLAREVGRALQSSAPGAVYPEVIETLLAGRTPGISQLTRRQYRELDPTIRKTLVDLWLGSGLASDASEIDELFEALTPAGA